MADTDDVLLTLIEQLRDDIARDRTESRESRQRMHQRMDEMCDRLGKVDTSLALSGEIDAQVRKELDELRGIVNGLAPTAREWDLLKRGGRMLVTWGGLTMAGVGAALSAWLSGAVQATWDALLHLLRLR